MDMIKVYDKTGLHVSSFSKRSIPFDMNTAIRQLNAVGFCVRSQLKSLGVKPHGKATHRKEKLTSSKDTIVFDEYEKL